MPSRSASSGSNTAEPARGGWIRYLLGGLASSSARWLALLCGGIALLVHSGLNAGGVWSFSSLVTGDAPLWRQVSDATSSSERAFLPLRDASLMLDRWFAQSVLGHNDPSGVAHITSWMLFALAVVLLVYLVYDICKHRWIAFGAGALVATHPIFAESVAWISRRGDVLALVFLFAAHLRWRWSRSRHHTLPVSALMLLVAAGLSRQWAWCYGLVLWLDACLTRSAKQASTDDTSEAFSIFGYRSRVATLLVVTLGGLVWEVVQNATSAHVTHVSNMEGVTTSLTSFFYALVTPWNHTFGQIPTPGAQVWTSIVGAVALLAVLVTLVAERKRFGHLLHLAIAAWLVMWLGHSGLWPVRTPLWMDHYGALAAPGLLVALTALCAKHVKWLPLVAAAVCGFFTWQGTPRFQNEEALWSHAHEQGGGGLASVGLGHALSMKKDAPYERILTLADAAMSTSTSGVLSARAPMLRSRALFGLGRFDDALDAANTAVTRANALEGNVPSAVLKRAQSESQVQRGKALQSIGDPHSAIEALRRSVLLDPNNALAHRSYGALLASSRDPSALKEAVKHLQRAVDLDPTDEQAYLALAHARSTSGDGAGALAVLDRAAIRHGRTPDILYSMASVHLQTTRDYEKARTLLRELQDVDRTHPKGSRLQCDLHIARGRSRYEDARATRKGFAEALHQFDLALDVDPTRWQAHMLAGDVEAAKGLYPAAVARYKDAKALAPNEVWIDGVMARTRALESAWMVSRAEDEASLNDAAKQMSAALATGATRIDLGFAPLEEELPYLEEVRTYFLRNEQPVSMLAAGVLRGAACLVAGDERLASKHVFSTMQRITENSTPAPVLDGCLLLRAMLYERSANLLEAERDYRMLEQRRPDDALPKLRLLQIKLRAAIARRKVAVGFKNEPETLEMRTKEVARVSARVVGFADRHPESTSAGLLAVEAEMHQRRWTPALARLNDMVARFCEREGKPPAEGCSSVYRGYNMVYLEQYLQNADVSLLRAGNAAVGKALTLDRRDARALLDSARLARIGQNPRMALKLAREAYGYEIKRGGPASRLLADLHVQMGTKALDDGNVKVVKRSIKEARKVDRAHAGTYLLQGKLMLRVRGMMPAEQHDRAISFATRAKELEPTNQEVNSFLARCYRFKGMQALVSMGMYRAPPKPETQPGFDKLSMLEQEERNAAWRKKVDVAIPAVRGKWRASAIDYFNQSLVLDPSAEEAADIKSRVENLKATDPVARFERRQEAQKAYERGEDLRAKGSPIKAMHAYERAIELHPRFERAHFRLAESAYKGLFGLRSDIPEERQMLDRLIARSLQSLQMLDMIDSLDRFPERWLYRGMLNRWLYRTDKQDEARVAAMRAYKRYLLLKEGTEDAPNRNVSMAKAHLRVLMDAE